MSAPSMLGSRDATSGTTTNENRRSGGAGEVSIVGR